MPNALAIPDCSAVFTADAEGMTPKRLAYALRRERVVRIMRGVYVAADVWQGDGFEADRRRAALVATAAARSVQGACASHTSAALLAGLPTWRIPARACLTVPPKYSGDSICAHLHRAKTAPEHVVPLDTVSRLNVPRTVLDIAREHGIEDAVVVGDAALHHGLTDERALVRCAAFCAGWPGIRRGRHVLDQLDGRAESPLESVSRLRLANTRIPAPDIQPWIYTMGGLRLGRLDFYWDEFGVAGEVDGRGKYRDDPDETHWQEKLRQEAMERTALVFVRWNADDLKSMPRLVRRIEDAFGRGVRTRADRSWVACPTPRPGALPRR